MITNLHTCNGDPSLKTQVPERNLFLQGKTMPSEFCAFVALLMDVIPQAYATGASKSQSPKLEDSEERS